MASRSAAPVVAVCWKALELRARVDPLSGELLEDPKSLGVSAADEAALEWALRCAERWGARVRVVSAGGPDCEAVLRSARGAGAVEAVRVEMDGDEPSEAIALGLAAQLRDAELVWCGDVGRGRGSGATGAYLAQYLDTAQALGLLAVSIGDNFSLEVVRRLDGGRRERLAVKAPAVLSCEGGTAQLRRAPLESVLSARGAPIEAVAPPLEASLYRRATVTSVGPYRPRARIVRPPEGETAADRIRSLRGGAGEGPASRAVELEPEAAAAAMLEALESWGELE